MMIRHRKGMAVTSSGTMCMRPTRVHISPEPARPEGHLLGFRIAQTRVSFTGVQGLLLVL